MDVDTILDGIFVGQERLTRDEIRRRAVAVEAPAEVATALEALPEGEYAEDEVAEALDQIGDLMPDLAPPDPRAGAAAGIGRAGSGTGVPGVELSDADLLREMGELHRT